MSKEDQLEFEGEVIETLPNTKFKVKNDDFSTAEHDVNIKVSLGSSFDSLRTPLD